MTRYRQAMVLLGAAALWSAGLVVAAFLVDAYRVGGTGSLGQSAGATIVQENGPGVIAVLALALLMTAAVAALLGRRYRAGRALTGPFAWTVVGLEFALVVAGMLSVGVFLLPVPVLTLVACAGARPARGHVGRAVGRASGPP
jgi:hypothetical protein